HGVHGVRRGGLSDGAIPIKYKELMAVAVALTIQYPYCIEIHAQRTRKAGATEQDLAETMLVTSAQLARQGRLTRDLSRAEPVLSPATPARIVHLLSELARGDHEHRPDAGTARACPAIVPQT